MRWTIGRRGAAPAVVLLAVTVILVLGFALTGTGTSVADPDASVEIKDAVSIEIGEATSRSIAAQIQAPGSATPEYVPDDLVTDVKWTTETASVPDRTTSPTNKVTPRTGAMVDAAIGFGLTRLGSVTCVGERSANPNSDHPSGRGCDLFFNPKTAAGVEAGWRTANWLVANQAVLGVKYVIWQGEIWNARAKPGPWTQYVSSAYGCPNPANVTGCHYDHVHVSMF